jgi:hypothetical protein
MAKTKAEVRNRALVMLGKLPLGQTPTSAMANDMEDAYDQVYARLNSRNMVTWSSTDNIPDEFVEDITALMAFERSEGIPAERYARVRESASRAFRNISALISGPYTNPREYTDY